MNTSLEMMSLTEECTLIEFVYQAWWPLDFVGYHRTRVHKFEGTFFFRSNYNMRDD